MTPMIPNHVSGTSALTILSGQRLQIRILNADGTVSSIACDAECLSGFTFTGNVSYFGTLS